jgi:hypothetical protein
VEKAAGPAPPAKSTATAKPAAATTLSILIFILPVFARVNHDRQAGGHLTSCRYYSALER